MSKHRCIDVKYRIWPAVSAHKTSICKQADYSINIHVCYPAVFVPAVYTLLINTHTHTRVYKYTTDKHRMYFIHWRGFFFFFILGSQCTHKCTAEAVLAWSIPHSLNDEEWSVLR